MRGPPAKNEGEGEQLPALEGAIREADELRPGDRVIYPSQGVCRVTGTEVKEIAGQRLDFIRVEREEDGAAVLVPRAKVPTIGLRRVASGEQMEGVFHYLAAQYDDPELDWKVRHRDNADRLIAGGVLGVAEVVKGLHTLSRLRPLPGKEREQYDGARHLLVNEVAVSLGVSPGLAEDYIDYALMPPAGVVFELKPPPKPVVLPARPRRKVVRTDAEDLALEDDLGLDLPAVPASAGEGEAEAEGEGEAEEEEAEGEEGSDEAIPVGPGLPPAAEDLPDLRALAAIGLADELELDPDESEGEGEGEEEGASGEEDGESATGTGGQEQEAEGEARPAPPSVKRAIREPPAAARPSKERKGASSEAVKKPPARPAATERPKADAKKKSAVSKSPVPAKAPGGAKSGAAATAKARPLAKKSPPAKKPAAAKKKPARPAAPAKAAPGKSKAAKGTRR